MNHAPPKAMLVGIALIAGCAALVLVATMPSTTEVYVDFEPRPVVQPLYAKILAFIDRDIQMRELSARIVSDARDQEEKADRLLLWTAQNIHPTPLGMPIIDDHPYSIIVRGYGEVDQAADVFANLAAYAGMAGGLVYSSRPDGAHYYAFAIVHVDGADRVFDVREGRVMRRRDGAPATLNELRTDPSMLDDLPPPAGARGVPYSILIANLDSGTIRRPWNQMPLSRLLNEIGKLLRR